jgi:hypothetical protein
MPHDRRRRGVPTKQRVNPDLDTAPIPLPEPLEYANELLACPERPHDVVLKERPTDHRYATTQVYGAGEDEHGAGPLPRSSILGIGHCIDRIEPIGSCVLGWRLEQSAGPHAPDYFSRVMSFPLPTQIVRGTCRRSRDYSQGDRGAHATMENASPRRPKNLERRGV